MDLSVVIPCLNEADTLAICIKKANEQIDKLKIDAEVIVSDKRFSKINTWLERNDFLVEKISYENVSKMSGLFRCSTLPLLRE